MVSDSMADGGDEEVFISNVDWWGMMFELSMRRVLFIMRRSSTMDKCEMR